MSEENIFNLNNCTLCPRNCHADRLHGQKGYCGESASLYAARAALLKWEEPVITGKNGSGAIFFSGCNMRCVFCQNRSISQEGEGIPVSLKQMTDIMLRLQEEEKATNLNLITAGHFLPILIPALERAKAEGLTIPVVYNTSSYEKVDAIKALEGLVDIYLPDLKYVSASLSSRYSAAGNYFDIATAAIAEMVRQQPKPIFSDGSSSLDELDDADDPVMVKGVVVRHLALPGCGEDSKAVLSYLYRAYGNRIFISIMNQYTPMPGMEEMGYPELSQRITPEEYDSLVDYALSLGVENGFIQEGDTAKESFIPAFDGTGIKLS